jgi:transcription factor S
MFCKKCGSILKPITEEGKRVFSCGKCNKTQEVTEKKMFKESIEETKEMEVIEDKEMHPKIRAECEKCGNDIAYYWSQQTRSADEPPTRFFRCTKCKFTWREYT